MAILPETQAEIQALRAKQLLGEALTLEEMRRAIILMRADRERASEVSAAARTKRGTKAAAPKAEDLLSELEGL